MPATEETRYNMKHLHRAFAVSSVALLIATIWMFAADHHRDWKSIQRTSDRVEARMAQWRKLQALTDDALADQEALKRDLSETLASQLPPDLVAQFCDELRREASHRGAAEPTFEELTGLLDELKLAATEGRKAGKAWQQAQLDADKAQLHADDASRQVADADPEERESIEQQARQRRAASERARAAVTEALEHKLTAETVVAPARQAALSWFRDRIKMARFREEELQRARKTEVARFDVAKAQFGAGVRAERPESDLADMQAEIDRLKQQIRETTIARDAAAAHRSRLQDLVRLMTEREALIRKRLDEATAELRRLDKLLVEKRSTYFEFYGIFPIPGKRWLELPILDAFNSPRKIENLWSEGLDQPLGSFGRVRRFDRCTTCHRSIQKALPGTSDEPAFRDEQAIDLALALPGERPAGFDANFSSGTASAEMVDRLFGIRLAADGLLHENRVTVNMVRATGLGGSSRPWTARGQLKRAGDMRDEMFHVLDAPASGGVIRPELMLGDVIEAIDGDPVPRDRRGRQWVYDKLVASAFAHWTGLEDGVGPKDSLRLTVRRGLPSPFAGHPRLDLFVGSLSPHRMSEFGCTVCHEGQGSATAFGWASHTPNNLQVRQLWKKKYGWFDNSHWEFPMHPNRFVESSCLKCHHDVLELESSERFPNAPAPKLAKGYRLIRSFGCFGCHEINGYDGPDDRVGPDLRPEPNYFAAALQFKGASGTGYDNCTEVEKRWIETLISAPEDNETRRQVYGMLEDDAQKADSINGNAQPLPIEKETTPGGDVAAEPRFSEYVHRTLTPLLKDQVVPGQLRKVGPSLRFARAKLDEAFLFDWIQNPSRLRPTTRMPQAFGLWDHLPVRRLRERRVELKRELSRLGDGGPTQEKSSHGELEQELATIDRQLRELDPIEARMEPIEIFSIVRYLLGRSQAFEYTQPPAGITPVTADEDRVAQIERGKIAFEQRGCLACHGHIDFPDIDKYRDADFIADGPDLSDIAQKFAATRNPNGRRWLYSWIQEPSRYNVRTTMPNLFLAPVRHKNQNGEVTAVTDPVADIVAYLMSVPGAPWQPGTNTIVELNATQKEDLRELTQIHLRDSFPEAAARRYMEHGIPEGRKDLVKGAERELAVTATESPSEDALTQKRIHYVARKSLVHHGCSACHDIPGMEDAKPIGPELTDWGRKKTSFLAFHSVAQYVRRHGPLSVAQDDEAIAEAPSRDNGSQAIDQEREELRYYVDQLEAGSRVGFIFQKLAQPRSFDYRETQNKNYTERLQMPQFPLTVDQREAVMTFVLGLVSDPPSSKYVYQPDPRTKAILEGHDVLVRFSCRACHLMVPEQWDLTFPAEDFGPQDRQSTFPFVATHFSAGDRQASRNLDRRGLRSATIRGMPALSDDGKPMILDEEEYPIEEEEDEEFDPAFLIYGFDFWQSALLDGEPYQIGEGGIEVPAHQITRRIRSYGGALTKYLLPIVVRRERETNPNVKGAEVWGWLAPPLLGEGVKVQSRWLRDYLLDPHLIRPATLMRMPKYTLSSRDATRLANYFAARDNTRFPHEYLQPGRDTDLAKSDAMYAAKLEELRRQGDIDLEGPGHGRRLRDAMRIITDDSYCVKCHVVGDYDPAGTDRVKAPDLAAVYRRLRTDYVRNWLAKPTSILPYTGMPVNIPYDPNAPYLGSTVPQDLYHGNSAEQLEALVDLLMNYDQYAMQRSKVAPVVEKARSRVNADRAEEN